MKISNELKKILLSATKVAEVVTVETKGKNVMVSASSSSFFFKGFCQGEEEHTEEMKLIIGKKAIELIKMIDVTEEITIDKKSKGSIEIKGGTTKATFTEEEEPKDGLDLTMSLNSASVVDISNVKSMLYAVANGENVKAALNCIEFNVSESRCTFLGTDGCRIARATEDLKMLNKDTPMLKESNFLVHKNEFNKLISIIPQGEVAFSYIPENNRAVFVQGAIMLGVKCVNEPILPFANFYNDLKGFKKNFLIDRDEFAKAIHKTLLGSDKVELEISDKSLKVSSTNNNLEISSDLRVTGENIDNEKIKIYFNAKYLLDMLNSISDEEVNIYFKDSSSLIGCWNEEIENILLPINPDVK
ncbi:TPA: hypothetical protein ACSQRE_000024 [Clostridium perfringens]